MSYRTECGRIQTLGSADIHRVRGDRPLGTARSCASAAIKHIHVRVRKRHSLCCNWPALTGSALYDRISTVARPRQIQCVFTYILYHADAYVLFFAATEARCCCRCQAWQIAKLPVDFALSTAVNVHEACSAQTAAILGRTAFTDALEPNALSSSSLK